MQLTCLLTALLLHIMAYHSYLHQHRCQVASADSLMINFSVGFYLVFYYSSFDYFLRNAWMFKLILILGKFEPAISASTWKHNPFFRSLWFYSISCYSSCRVKLYIGEGMLKSCTVASQLASQLASQQSVDLILNQCL